MKATGQITFNIYCTNLRQVTYNLRTPCDPGSIITDTDIDIINIKYTGTCLFLFFAPFITIINQITCYDLYFGAMITM